MITMRSVKIILISSFIILSTRAEIPLPLIHGMSTCMKQGYEQCAPALGALYWNTHYIRTLFRFGLAEDAAVKLIKLLFNINVDGSFDITHSALQIASYFDPAVVGQLVGVLYLGANIKNETDRIMTSLMEEKKNLIKDSIIEGLTRTLSRQRKEIADEFESMLRVDDVIKSAEYATIRELVEDPSKITSKEVKKVSKLKKYYPKGLSTKIAYLEKNEKPLDQQRTSMTIVNRHFIENKNDLCENLEKAILEEKNNKSPQGITISLLLAWLWREGNGRDDIRNYVDNLAKTLKKPSADVFNWPLPSPFTKEDYQLLTQKKVEEIQTLPLEDLIFARFGFDLYENPLPPEIGMSGDVSCFDPKSKNIICTYPDCGETSLRNFLNALLYDSLKSEFDLNILKKITTYQPLIDFYQRFKNVDMISTAESHDQWSQVVSAIPDVIYHNPASGPICNISSGVSNMFNVIRYLIPGATSFSDLQEILGRVGISLRLDSASQQELAAADKGIDVTFEIERQDAKFSLTWSFLSGHFKLAYPEASMMLHSDSYREAIKEKIKQKEGLSNWSMVLLAVAYGMPLEELYIPDNNVFNQHVIMTTSTRKYEDNIKISQNAIKMLENRGIDEKVLMNIIAQAYNTLPEDIGLIREFLDNVISSSYRGMITIYKALIPVSDKENKREEVIYKILELNMKEEIPFQEIAPLYNWIKSNITKMSYVVDKKFIIEEIIETEFFKDPLKNDFLKTLYEWVGKELIQSNDIFIKQTILGGCIKNDTKQVEKIAALKDLYELLPIALDSLENDLKKNYFYEILEKKMTTDMEYTLFKGLFVWAKNMLPLIAKDEEEKKKIRASIEQLMATGTQQEKEALKIVYDAIPQESKD